MVPSLTADTQGSESVHEDVKEVQYNIVQRTWRLAGDQKAICDEPIVVKLKGASLHSLGFLDLPGLTKIPIRGQ